MLMVVRRLWDRLAIYLPIILMGVLALGTYWLVRSTPAYEETPQQRLLKHEPDYFMQKFSVRTFESSGAVKNQIFGAEAKHYPDTDILEIQQIRWTGSDGKLQQITAFADQAVANSDASEVQMIGHAVLRRDSAPNRPADSVATISLQGEFFHVFMDTGQMKSHKPVELTAGNNRFTANSMQFDLYEQVVQMRGRVRGVLQPPRRK